MKSVRRFKIKKITSEVLISVIIPTYNRANDLKRCLDSLNGQSCKNFEAIVVDDGSTDNTSEVVANYNYNSDFDLKYIYIENFGGPARPRNVGIKNSMAKYVAFLDSDDWYHEDKIKKSLESLNKGADFVYHDLVRITDSRNLKKGRGKVKTRNLHAPVFDDLILKGTAIANSSVVVRKSIIKDAGLFSEDPELIAAEDFEAWLRVAKVTEKFKRLSQPLAYYWAGGGNISSVDRTINNYAKIVELYSEDIKLRLGTAQPQWIEYDLSRCYFYKKNYEKAMLHAKNAFNANTKRMNFFKCLVSFMQIYLFKLYRK